MNTLGYGVDPGRADRAARWMYRGLWAILVRFFRLPEEPPALPAHASEDVLAFRPAPAFLTYLKLQYWIGTIGFDVGFFVGLIGIAINEPAIGALLAVPVVLVLGLINVVSYIAVYLRFDTTWYVVSDRSMRLRQGVWSIHEVTITFENIQNVRVRQGPLQRYLGIADVVVETAGGGGAVAAAGNKGQTAMSHHGVIRGIANAREVRDRILARLKRSRSSGIGDEASVAAHLRNESGGTMWTPAHLALLREIRDAVARRSV